jgi:hypothetical protein
MKRQIIINFEVEENIQSAEKRESFDNVARISGTCAAYFKYVSKPW